MNKKWLLLLGFALGIVIVGDLLYILTHSRLLANWGSIIFPSILIGFAWKRLIHSDIDDQFRFIIPGLLAIVKLVLFLLLVKKPTLLAAVLTTILYPIVSLYFIKLGVRLAQTESDRDKSNLTKEN